MLIAKQVLVHILHLLVRELNKASTETPSCLIHLAAEFDTSLVDLWRVIATDMILQLVRYLAEDVGPFSSFISPLTDDLIDFNLIYRLIIITPAGVAALPITAAIRSIVNL